MLSDSDDTASFTQVTILTRIVFMAIAHSLFIGEVKVNKTIN